MCATILGMHSSRHFLLGLLLVGLLTACGGDSTPPPPRSVTLTPTPILVTVLVEATSIPESTAFPVPTGGLDQPLARWAGSDLTAAAVSPDGLLIAIGGRESLSVLSALTLEAIWEEEPNTIITDLAFSGAGGLLAVGLASGEVQIWDALGGTRLRTMGDRPHRIQKVAWTPDSARLITATNRALVRWNVLTGEIVRETDPPDGSVTGLAVSPDGLHLAITSDAGQIQIHDQRQVVPLFTLGSFFEAVTSAAWSPDGLVLATGMESGRIILWDMTANEPIRNLDGHRGGVPALAWSPDGTRLLSGDGNGLVIEWDPLPGTRLRTLHGLSSSVLAAGYGWDGGPAPIGIAVDGRIVRWGQGGF